MTDVLWRFTRYFGAEVVTLLYRCMRPLWCRLRDYRIYLVVLLSLLLIFWADLLANWFFRTTTMTLTAETDSVQFDLGRNRPLVWKLPPGRVMTLTDSCDPRCSRPNGGIWYEREFDENTLLVVKEPPVTEKATIATLQVSPDGELMISVSSAVSSAGDPCIDSCIHAELQNAEGKTVLQETRSFSFETISSNADDHALRYPIIAGRAVLGSALHDHATLGGDEFDFWQPVLHSGTVQILAQNWPGSDKYEVLSDTVAAGDVVELAGPAPLVQTPTTGDLADSRLFRTANAAPEEKGSMSGGGDGGNAIWGMIEVLPEYKSVGHGAALAADGDDGARPRAWEYRMKVVLHTALNEIGITRFGASQPHTVKASGWSIIARWPTGQQGWVIFVSLTVFLTFVYQAKDYHRCISKDRKEKRNGARENTG
jgi:hypothetical protein